MPATPPRIAKATMTALPNGAPLAVHFNPSSLVYSVENTVSQQSGGPSKAQYVAQFSGKLTMDLLFDTTDTGADVRTFTNQVAMFMQATGNASAAAQNTAAPSANSGTPSTPPKAPPVLSFKWGSYEFKGIMDSFKETIDFFSADGVALRALVSIGLSRQDHVFDDDAKFSSASTSGNLVQSSAIDSALSLATRGGDPSAARAIGAANGMASLRFTGGASVEVGGGVQLNPPAAFVSAPSASAGAGFGISLGGGITAGAGISMGGGAGISVGGSGGGSTLGPSFGASASAGVPASAGAFAGLQTGRSTTAGTTANLNPLTMMNATPGASVTTGRQASFSLGGAANSTGPTGLSTNVGTRFSFADRLTFNKDD